MKRLRERSRRSRMPAVLFGGLLTLSSGAVFASGEPAPGATTAMTVRLPSGPGSVRGLADDPVLEPFSGQVTYSVPLDLPAAQRGYKPPLAIGYNGSLGTGPLGIGWYMSLPKIERDTRLGTPAYNNTDQLVLTGFAKGGRLVPVGDGSFRVESQGNEILVKPIEGGGYLVKDSDGVSYRLGVTRAGQQSDGALVAPKVSAWFVEEILDVDGRSLCKYSYVRDSNEMYLDRVSWGPENKFYVQTALVERTDKIDSYRTGYKVTTSKRISAIEVHSFGALLRTYAMTYDETLPLSRLKQVDQTGLEGAGHMPALSFQYASVEAMADTVKIDTAPDWQLGTGGVTLADLDGDGAADLLRISPTGHSWRRNLGGSFGPATLLTGATSATLSNARLVDVEGRAIPNLVTTEAGKWVPYHIQGAGWSANSALVGTANLPLLAANTAMLDVNGDSRIDVLKSNGNSFAIYLGTKDGLAPSFSRPLLPGLIDIGPNIRWEDVNGDRIADALQVTEQSTVIFVGKGDGTFENGVRVDYPWTRTRPVKAIRFADLNRDGIADLLSVEGQEVCWYAGQPPFGFSSTPVCPRPPDGTSSEDVVELADVNGNGSVDVIWSTMHGMWLLDPAGSTHAGMLVGVNNGLGKQITFDYKTTMELSQDAEKSGQAWTYLLPASIPVAVASTIHMLTGEPDRKVEYEVRDGFWDSDEVSFGGFLIGIKRTPKLGSARQVAVQTRYNSGLAQSRVLRGKPVEISTYLDEVKNTAGQVVLPKVPISSEKQVWIARNVAGLPATVPLLKVPTLKSTQTSYFEGRPEGSPIITRTRYTHDDQGRDVRKDEDGRLDLTGDERSTVTRYADDLDTWVRSRVCDEQVLSGNGTLVQRTQTLYGDATRVGGVCEVVRGWPRKTIGSLVENGVERPIVLTETSYDVFGNILTSVEGGVTRKFVYDALALHPLSESLKPDATHTLTWTSSWNNVQGVIATVTEPNGVAQYASYDALGRVVGIGMSGAPEHVHYEYLWDGPMPPQTITYTFAGRTEQLQAFQGTWTAGSGWRESIAVVNGAMEPLFKATRLTAGRWIVSGWNEHDEYGNVTFVASNTYWDHAELPTVRPTTVGQTLAYDPLGRLIDQVLPTGSHKRVAYSALSETTTTDGLVAITTQADGLGRVLRTQRPDGTGALQSVVAEYDAVDHLTAMNLQEGRVSHRFTYDTLGRLTHAQDPDVGPRDMTYNDAGKLLQVRNGAAQTTNFTYDGAGRLLEERGSDGGGFRYHYDAAPAGLPADRVEGRLAWVEEPTGTIALSYDALGNVERVRRTIDGNSIEERSVHASSGDLLEMSYDDGFSIAYQYDDAGRPRKVGDYWELNDEDASGQPIDERFGNGVTQRSDRNPNGLLSAVRIKSAAGVSIYDVGLHYNEWFGITEISDNDGGFGLDHSATFTYDGLARLTTATIGRGPSRFAFAYGYDALQNLTSRTQSSGPRVQDLLLGDYKYGTDANGPRQLKSVVDATGAARNFTYDGAGRQVTQGGQHLVYNSLDQLLRVDGLPDGHGGNTGVVQHAYGYDGTRVKTVAPSGEVTYWFSQTVSLHNGAREYGVQVGDRVVARVTMPSAAVASSSAMAADAVNAAKLLSGLGLLISIGGLAWVVFTPLASRRSRPLFNVRATAATLLGTLLVASCGGNAQNLESTGAAISGRQVLYMHQGVSAGPTLFTSDNGEVVEDRRYEPFGEDLDSYRKVNGTFVVTSADFASVDLNDMNKRTDPATGWSYHGARWMNPGAARWLTPDPPTKGPDGEYMRSPWSLNPYQYVEQNPILFWDPDGREKKPNALFPWPGGAQGETVTKITWGSLDNLVGAAQNLTRVNLMRSGIAQDLKMYCKGTNLMGGWGLETPWRNDRLTDWYNLWIMDADVQVSVEVYIANPKFIDNGTGPVVYTTTGGSTNGVGGSNTSGSSVGVSAESESDGDKIGISAGGNWSQSLDGSTTNGGGVQNQVTYGASHSMKADVYFRVTVSSDQIYGIYTPSATTWVKMAEVEYTVRDPNPAKP